MPAVPTRFPRSCFGSVIASLPTDISDVSGRFARAPTAMTFTPFSRASSRSGS